MKKKQTGRHPTPLAKRLARVMDEMDWNQSDLARAAKCQRQTVSSWMTGSNENMRDGNHAVNIQARSRFNASWIVTGKGPVYITALSPEEERLLEAIRTASEDHKTALRVIFPALDI